MHHSLTRFPSFLVVAWLAILLKCVAVTWAVSHWQMPIQAGWLVWPTLIFGALATAVWLSQRRQVG